MDEAKSKYDIDAQLERCVEWVKFAEAKNGIAFTLLGALLVELFDKDAWKFGLVGIALIISVIVLLVLLLLTFIPRMSPVIKGTTEEEPENAEDAMKILNTPVNLNFYGDICKVPLWAYRKKVIQSYPEYGETSKHFLDVTHQIWINCKIAVIKFKWFKRVCFCMTIPFILIAIVA